MRGLGTNNKSNSCDLRELYFWGYGQGISFVLSQILGHSSYKALCKHIRLHKHRTQCCASPSQYLYLRATTLCLHRHLGWAKNESNMLK